MVDLADGHIAALKKLFAADIGQYTSRSFCHFAIFICWHFLLHRSSSLKGLHTILENGNYKIYAICNFWTHAQSLLSATCLFNCKIVIMLMKRVIILQKSWKFMKFNCRLWSLQFGYWKGYNSLGDGGSIWEGIRKGTSSSRILQIYFIIRWVVFLSATWQNFTR